MNNKGFSIIELIIYMGILALVLTALVNFSFVISDSKNKNFVIQEVNANTRTAMNLMTQTIRSATSTNDGTSTYGSDPGVLSLGMADPTKNPTIISLNADDGQIQIKEGTKDAIAITSDEIKVTNLVFTNLTGSSARKNIRIQMSVEYDGDGDIDFTYDTDVTSTISFRH